MNPEKINFLKNEFVPLLRTIQINAQPKWGKMNPQQMIEHMSDSFRIASGKDPHHLHTPLESVEKFKAFAMSDKPFKENTKNALLPDEPMAVRHVLVNHALSELQLEIDDFFNAFGTDPSKRITNPFFGDLNFEEWVQLLHKHSVHHLKQFGIN